MPWIFLYTEKNKEGKRNEAKLIFIFRKGTAIPTCLFLNKGVEAQGSILTC